MKKNFLTCLCLPFVGLLGSACTTQSGPPYTMHSIVAAEGRQTPTYQVTCAGLLESSQSCLKAAQKICLDKPVTPLEYVDGLRGGVRTNNPREITFMRGEPAQSAVKQQPPPLPHPQPHVQPVQQMLLQGDANFATDSAALTAAAKTRLDSFVHTNNDVSFLRVTVTGYTDSRGARAHNQELSDARAASVAQYLRSHAVDSQEFLVRGAGAEDPIESNATADGRALNRRVQVRAVA
ncbi:OmpA family protein [Paraburkholderia sediminicola]|nr:OmpA family protein [Paraburkholderia sediminicola]